MKKGTDKTKAETFEYGGTTYTAQFNGVRAAMVAINKYARDEVKFEEYLLENVLVDPAGVTLDDFETVDECVAVTRWLARVMKGNFRSGADAGDGAGKSEK